MNFSDILALAKQGYKPADIKELLAIEVPEQTPNEPEPAPNEPEQTPSEPELAPSEPEQTPNKQEQNEEIEKLKNQIKDLQKENARKDISKDIPNDEDIIADFIRGFM